MRFSWGERLLFLFLLCASLYAFWRSAVGRTLRIIFGSRPDPDFSLRPLAPRVLRFLREVAVPAEGHLAAAAGREWLTRSYFWGFCAFALVTLNHMAAPSQARVSWNADRFARFYFGWPPSSRWQWRFRSWAWRSGGLCCGRAGWEPLSPESGLIAGLIFGLMVTYLATFWLHGDFARGEERTGGCTPRSCCSFLPVIPHSKHLHLAAEPGGDLPGEAGVRADSAAGRATRISGWTPGKDITRLVALQAVLLRRVRALHRALPCLNTGKVLNPKEIILGDRAHTQRVRTGQRAAAVRQAHLDGSGVSSAQPAAPASSSVRWAFSTCR